MTGTALTYRNDTVVGFPGEVRQADIYAVQAMLSEVPQVECPVRHLFSKGIYTREIYMPADTFVIGKLHATEHPNIMLKGEVTVWTAQDGAQRIKAPCVWISGAGVKKMLYTHSDTVWLTVHATDETDLERLEAELIIDQPIDADFVEVARQGILGQISSGGMQID